MSGGARSGPVDSDSLLKNPGIKPNILDQYTHYEYHFRLYMLPIEFRGSAAARNESSTNKEIVLAETAVTSTAIEDVKITSVGGMNKQIGVGISTKFEIVLKQPYGVTFIDSIADAAAALGIPQILTAPYYLELTFRARDPDTQKPIESGELSHLRWVWPILFLETSIDVVSSGSTYRIQAVLYDDNAMLDTKTKKEISINARTVGGYFDQLAIELNRRERNSIDEGTKTKADSFAFEYDEQIRELEFSTSDNNESNERSRNEDGTITISFPPETSIQYIVKSVLSSTEFFQRQVTENNSSQNTEERGADKNLFSTLFRLVPSTSIREFDFLTNDYTYEYKYSLKKYKVTTLQTDVNPQRGPDEKQVTERITRGVLTKIYNYLFTGLNDQILDFNMQFNFNWYIALPWQGGNKIQSSTSDNAGAVNLSGEDIAIITGSRNALQAQIEQQQPALEEILRELDEPFISIIRPDGLGRSVAPHVIIKDEKKNREALDEYQDRREALVRSLGEFERLKLGVESLTDVISSAEARKIQRQQALAEAAAEREAEFNRSRVPWERARDRLSNETGDRPVFAEELSEAEEIIDKGTPTFVNRPIFRENSPATEDVGIEGANNPGRALVSTLFEQVISPLNADLVNIEMKIKGDPYWLEPGPAKTGQFSTYLTTSETTNNSINTQTYFLFRSFLPDSPDPVSGITPGGSQNTVINGLYFVRETLSEFSRGTFTQTLFAIRDPSVNVNNIKFDDAGNPIIEEIRAVEEQTPTAITGSDTPTVTVVQNGRLIQIPVAEIEIDGVTFDPGRGVLVADDPKSVTGLGEAAKRLNQGDKQDGSEQFVSPLTPTLWEKFKNIFGSD